LESNNVTCSLICVGSELLRGKINTHASTLARRLASVGIDLHAEHSVGDELEDLATAIRQALQTHPLVIVTGGLGPTFDDLTREAAAAAVSRPLVLSSILLKEIFRKFKKAGYKNMPPANKRQAYVLEGALPIPNHAGTASGQWLELMKKRVLILLPGPPSELNPMLENAVLPKLRKVFPSMARVEAHLHFVGVPESIVDHKIRPIIEKEKGVQFTILAHLGLVDFDVFVSDASRAKAVTRLSRIVKSIRQKMGAAFYGMDDDYPLEKIVMKRFLSHHETLAVAESCTGGMLSQRLTDIAGSSQYFLGGIVSYSNDVKTSALGISSAVLQKYGAVSRETALAMAEGIRRKCSSTWGLSITGIAGPGGATPGKPVGLVYIGLSGPHARKALELHFRGNRDVVRQRSVIAALDLLRLISRPTLLYR